MDRIRSSNEFLLRTLESVEVVDWLITEKYSSCCHAVVFGSLKKKFERPDNTNAIARKTKAISDVLDRNRLTWTDKRPATHQVELCSLTKMIQAKSIMTTWFRGATFTLDDAWCGPGETFRSRRGHTSPLDKWTGVLGVTPNALPLAKKFIRRTPYLLDAARKGEIRIEVQPGNRMSTVPKTTAKDRVICMEPELNMALQKAVGRCFRRVYKKVFGRDLDDVQSYHRKLVHDGLVQVGSQVYTLATIDLSAASDSISMLLCKEILPPWIFDLVVATRSPTFVYEDKVYPWSIVSSMGNGFTFELLSLVCAIACRLAGAKFFSVYGDDIIVDSDSAHNLIETLKHLGFSVNEDKTCVDLPQLESCGAFSYEGIPILRYENTWLENDNDVITLLNKLYKLNEFYKNYPHITSITQMLWLEIYKLNHQHLPCGPNHDCEVDGRWVMLPRELYPTKKTALPSWAQKACDAYCFGYEDAWVIPALYFEADTKSVTRPQSPNSYCFARQRLMACPTVGVRGKGSWVRKVTLVVGTLVMTRSSWNKTFGNEWLKANRLGSIISYPDFTGST